MARLLALLLMQCAHAVRKPRSRAVLNTPRRGGASGPFDDARRALDDWRVAAPATHAAAHASVVTFVLANSRFRRLVASQTVCCVQLVKKWRLHSILLHALVQPSPHQLLFGLWTLLVLAKPLEEKVGSQRFGHLALAGVLGGALGASCLQLLGASGGVTGLGPLAHACGAVLVRERPFRPVGVLFCPGTLPALAALNLLLAFNVLLAFTGHPGGAANVGGCIAGYTLARFGYLPARWPPPAPVRPLPATPEVSAAGLFAEEGVSSLG
mmetsp:Transcript_27270/g.81788  ORF Transcript_27270/g.81788 Transcript_27270/m.81788 type:complete len:268 (-) Transcript_27270:24-827(-)